MYKNFLLIPALLCITAGSIFAQTPLTNYFIESSYLRNSLNPALRPNRGYIGFPLLSGVAFDYKTNTFNLNNFTREIDGERVTFMHQGIDSGDFMSNISQNNYLSADFGYEALSFGFYKNAAFWNVSIGLKTHIDVNIPKEFFGLLKEGFGQNHQTEYALKEISSTQNSYLELGVSYSRPLFDDHLIVGLKTKLLGGIANYDLNIEDLTINAGPDHWLAKSKVRLDASAPGLKVRQDRDNILNVFDTADLDIGLAGYGFGFDVGAVYDFSKFDLPVLNHLRASVAVTDIGYIFWSKKNSAQLKSPEEAENPGIKIEFGGYEIHTDGSTSMGDILQDVIDDLNEAINLKEYQTGGRSTSLRSTLNVGLEYLFLDNKLSAGLLYSNRYGNYFNTRELTVSGNFRPLKWIAASLSYSFMHSNYNTFGGAIYLMPDKMLHFFVAGDYIIPHVSPQYIPSVSNALNIQFGVSMSI